MASFSTLPQHEIDEIVKVADYILSHQSSIKSISEVKKKFGLTTEQYNMVYDFCMPLIRRWNVNEGYWNTRYKRFKMRIVTAIRMDKSELAEKIRHIVVTDNDRTKILKEEMGNQDPEDTIELEDIDGEET